ncbi:MAG: helix-turn-helix transcriptional regulator [Nitrospirota bacterium]
MKTAKLLVVLGEKIREVRKGKKLSQERLAELSNLHPTYISDIENGKVNASLYSYYQIAQALTIPLSELVVLPQPKAERQIEFKLTELFSQARALDRKKKAVFIAAARGLLSGIDEVL